ncbi:hypothetical protein KZZ52_31970 [Dactylosporangium sp. AC04546]|uniref:WD40 repeat domain-containing protein n=1 Tax=Dactylosporangium sp. AC04546 TaxID=2862460 RepID=UPI001EE095F8|nr:hypothetical protein [Dactylosporangium sp. AC04546]WVK78610.1 hypothetical protein KZZ52_31970 [Dactylosporangium sp. AC04546]
MHVYGSAAFRSCSRSFRSMVAADGRTLLIQDSYRLSDNDMSKVLQAMDIDTGTVVVGDRVLGFAPVRDLVVAALADNPSTLGVYRVPDLAPVRTVPIGVPADEQGLAAGGGTVAVLCGEAGSVVVLDTGTWQARHVDLPGRPVCVTVSDDGALVVVGTDQGRTGRVVVVDAASGTIRYLLTGPRKAVGSVAVRGDLVVASTPDLVLAWTLPPSTATRRSTAAPKASTLYTSGKNKAAIAGVTPGGLVLARDGPVTAAVEPVTGQVVWSSADMHWSSRVILAGDRLIWAGEREVYDRDPESGTVRQTWPVWGPAHLHGVTPELVAFSTMPGGRVELLHKLDGPSSNPAGHGSLVRDVSFDGERFATVADDRWAFVWSRGQTDPVVVIDGARQERPGAAVHLTGDALYTSFGGCVQRWSLDGSATTATPSAESMRFDDDVTLIRVLPGSRLLLAAVRAARWGSGELRLLDAVTLETVDRSSLDSTVYAAYPLDDHRLLLCGDRVAVEYDTVACRHIRRKIHADQPATHARNHLYPDRSLLIETRTYWTERETGHGLSFGGRLTVTDLTDRTVRHDRIETEEFTGRGDLSADGVFATPHRDAIRLWDLDAGKVVHELPAPPLINRVWWFPDGNSLLTSTHNGALHEVPGMP